MSWTPQTMWYAFSVEKRTYCVQRNTKNTVEAILELYGPPSSPPNTYIDEKWGYIRSMLLIINSKSGL